jgi:hypothetical protein
VCAFAAATALLMSLTISPRPTSSPTSTISWPIASNSGRARRRCSGAPLAMIVSVPSSALGLDPVTGASTKLTSRSASCAAIRRLSPGAIVDMSTHRVPGAAPVATAFSPSSTSATCAPSTTIVMTMSLAAPTSAGVSTTVPPCSAAHASARSRVRL